MRRGKGWRTARHASIVANGRNRARAAAEPFIREEAAKQIAAEFASRLSEAGPLRRVILGVRMRRAIRREIRRRLKEVAPTSGLY